MSIGDLYFRDAFIGTAERKKVTTYINMERVGRASRASLLQCIMCFFRYPSWEHCVCEWGGGGLTRPLVLAAQACFKACECFLDPVMRAFCLHMGNRQ